MRRETHLPQRTSVLNNTMALPCPLEKMDKSQPPPPCKIAAQPEEQALNAGKGFIQNVYAAMDGGAHGSIPFRQNSCVAFKQGAADRYEVCLPQPHALVHPLAHRARRCFPGCSSCTRVRAVTCLG